MTKLWLAGLSAALLDTSAMAEGWYTDFNMGSLLAGGGSAAGGYLSFECMDEGDASDPVGRPFLSLSPMAGVNLNKKAIPPEGVSFWVGDDQSFLVPMSVERGGKSMSYDYSEESVQVRWLVEALRQGDTVTAFAGAPEDLRLIAFTLEGSRDALELIDGCIAARD